MSWLDKVKNGMTIVTGDDERYTPDWLNASFKTEYRHSLLEFIDVQGTYVDRRNRIGIKYNMEIYFQGADHIDIAKKFRESTDNNREPWLIEHPMYDIITVQPIALDYDNSQGNVTKITGTVIETIQNVNSNFLGTLPIDEIEILNSQTTDLAVNSITETPGPEDVNSMAAANSNTFKKGVRIIESASGDYEAYYDAFNTAATFINSATATPLLAMNSLIRVIQMPGLFAAEVKQRIGVLTGTFDDLRQIIFGQVTVASKQIYSAQQIGSVAAMCLAAASPLPSDYKNADEVLEVLDKISGRYSQLVTDLDSLQTSNAGGPLSFVIDAELILSLDRLVKVTVTNLFTIALNSRTERTFICDQDTNWITLTHKLYGLDAIDANINELMNNNKFTLDEILQIPKGRKIVYYI